MLANPKTAITGRSLEILLSNENKRNMTAEIIVA